MTGPEDAMIERLNVLKGVQTKMEFWFSEQHTPNVKLSIRVDRQLYSGRSEFQRIDVFDSPEFGRFLTLDGYMMLTEKDEFIYHEMITHVPMAVHPNVRDVLVIGAGDGGVVRELTRYPEIEHIDLVEIDQLVVEVCKKYLPQTACRLDDPRVHIHYRGRPEVCPHLQGRVRPDHRRLHRPVRPGRRAVHPRVLRQLLQGPAGGRHHGQPAREPLLRGGRPRLPAGTQAHRGVLPHRRVYQAHIPTYPSGHWLFGFATKKYHPLRDLDEARWNARHFHAATTRPRCTRAHFTCPPTWRSC